MTDEILAAMTSLGSVHDFVFPKELKSGFFGQLDRQFVILLLVCIVTVFTTIGILSLRKPAEAISQKEIQQIQERYAQLVLKQPEANVESSLPEVEKKTGEKAAQIEKEDATVKTPERDPAKETFAEKMARKESGGEERRKIREQNAQKIESAGIFAALTYSGGASGSESSTIDLLGSASLGVTDLGNLSLSKGSFAKKNDEVATLAEKKGERKGSVGIEREVIGRTSIAEVASNAQVTIANPPEITGESASLLDRSQAAIQTVVGKESRRLKRLYEEWLKRDPSLSGRLTIKFVIMPSGAVSDVAVVKSSTGNTDFDEMIVRYIKRWKFPAVEGSGPVEVVYPFVFEGSV